MTSSFLILLAALAALTRPAVGQVDSTTPPAVESPAPAVVDSATPPPVESVAPAAADSATPPPVESVAPAVADSTAPPPVESAAPAVADSTAPPAVESAAPAVTDSTPSNVMRSMFGQDSTPLPAIGPSRERLARSLPQPVMPPQVVDRIVAVVGVTPILSSQLDEQLLMARSQGTQLPQDSASLADARRQILDQLVSEELLVQQAERDTSVRVTEQEVQDQVEKTVGNVRRQFSTDAEFLGQLGAAGFGSEEEWRRWLADNQRRSILQQRLIESMRQKGKLRPIPPTEEELRIFWEQDKLQRPKQPPQVSYRQIVIAVLPDSGALAGARARAESLVVALRRGANFAELAKTFSADTASRAQGGELGWFRRGVMVKSFEDVAFRLKPGEISDVVPSPFGFHIIQVERVQPAEIQARHILIQPVVSKAQIERTRHLADSVYQALVAGASFDSVGRRYSDFEESPLNEDVPIAQLTPDYAKVLGTVTAPGLVPPLEVGADTPRPKFAIVDVTKWRGEGEMSFDDVKDRLRQQLAQQQAIKRYIDTLRRSTYVEVRL
ncbi:MAG TPA: peptidylprolyl isomerase [Gemmatimonadales bacterium]|nr:peptidylprolyl isomerase [Gemmatimonadales bacterium]